MISFDSVKRLITNAIVIPIKIGLLVLAGYLLYLSITESANILLIILLAICLTIVMFPFTTNGYYSMYRVIFPLSIIGILILIVSYGPIADVIQSFFNIMNRDGFIEAMKQHFFNFLVISVCIFFAYYIWQKFIISTIFKRVVRIEKNGKLSAVIGRAYWITGNAGRYDRLRYRIHNIISLWAAKLLALFGKKIEIRKAKPTDIPVIYIVQAGFPFFNPRIDMIKLYGCEITQVKLPGYLAVKYPGHLECIGHNRLAPAINELNGIEPMVVDYHQDVETYLDMHAIRTQRAVTLDAELNKSQIMKSSAYMPTNLKEWAERLAKKKENV